MSKVFVANIFTAAIWLGTGIACLVITLQNPPCGVGGSPPLSTWLFGSGIAYIIIGALSILFGSVSLLTEESFRLIGYILALASTFIFAWAIVGAVTLANFTVDCQLNHYPVYAMGLAAVIITWVTWGCCSFGSFLLIKT